jgi:hypothetical protein
VDALDREILNALQEDARIFRYAEGDHAVVIEASGPGSMIPSASGRSFMARSVPARRPVLVSRRAGLPLKAACGAWKVSTVKSTVGQPHLHFPVTVRCSACCR